MKTPDLEIYEAARNYLAAFQKSQEMTAKALDASGAAYDRKKDLIKLLHELFDIEETMCLHLEDGRLLVCHYDCEEGFVDFSEIQAFVEADAIPPKPEDEAHAIWLEKEAMNESHQQYFRPKYSTEFITVSDSTDPLGYFQHIDNF